MSTRLLPYLAFPGNGTEAMAYYRDVFGGSLNATTYGDLPMEMPFTPPPGALAHGHLDAGAVQLTGGDAMGETPASLESGVYSFLLEADSIDEARGLIETFTSTGGTVEMPFEPAPWGGHYGQVKDRYGVLWAFSVDDSEG